MVKTCKGCKEEEQFVYRDGKQLMRFIRKNKKPSGAMQNYDDGQVYWMHPRHAFYQWWEPVEDIKMPIVTEENAKSVYESVALKKGEVEEESASIGDSGITLTPDSRVVGDFVEPAETTPPELPEEQEPNTMAIGLFESTPSDLWNKIDLISYITLKGGVAKSSMKKDLLLSIALNLKDV